MISILKTTLTHTQLKDLVWEHISSLGEDAIVDDYSIATALDLDGLLVHDICMELAEDGLLVETDWPEEE